MTGLSKHHSPLTQCNSRSAKKMGKPKGLPISIENLKSDNSPSAVTAYPSL